MSTKVLKTIGTSLSSFGRAFGMLLFQSIKKNFFKQTKTTAVLAILILN